MTIEKKNRTDLADGANVSDVAGVIEKTAAFVRERLSGEGTGHDWWHIQRVWKSARFIGQAEGADLFVVELAALLHDIADWKFHHGDLSAGPREARSWLEKLKVDEAVIAKVCDIIVKSSFKGANVKTEGQSLEGQVLQDADRLDALGAIGVARAFAYGGAKGRGLHDPRVPPVLHGSFEQYRDSKAPTLNHFYEKLLLLKDRMNTPTGRRLALERHEFMEKFVSQFLKEWDTDWNS